MAMDENTLRAYIKEYIHSQPSQEVWFTWQGGEPTLAGLEFYRKAVQLQSEYAAGKTVRNSFQTNAIRINDDWARFFHQHQFFLGVSIDGPDYIHDKFRVTGSNRASHAKVMNAIKTLKRHHVEFNTLTVINSASLSHAQEIYQFLTQEVGSDYLQFIPVVEHRDPYDDQLIYPKKSSQAKLTEWSITGQQYGDFMKDIFLNWIKRDVGKVFVQLFENALAAWAGYTPSLCIMRPTCGDAMILEQNGDIYSCDHFVYPEFKLGNVVKDDLSQIVGSKRQKHFGASKAQLTSVCHQCEFKFVCHGGCPKHRTIDIGQKNKQNHLCAGYKTIFSTMKPYMEYMVKLHQSGQPLDKIMKITSHELTPRV